MTVSAFPWAALKAASSPQGSGIVRKGFAAAPIYLGLFLFIILSFCNPVTAGVMLPELPPHIDLEKFSDQPLPFVFDCFARTVAALTPLDLTVLRGLRVLSPRSLSAMFESPEKYSHWVVDTVSPSAYVFLEMHADHPGFNHVEIAPDPTVSEYNTVSMVWTKKVDLPGGLTSVGHVVVVPAVTFLTSPDYADMFFFADYMSRQRR